MTPPVPGGSLDRAVPAVADALRRLEGLQDRPLADQVEVFDGVHRVLQDVLASLDEA